MDFQVYTAAVLHHERARTIGLDAETRRRQLEAVDARLPARTESTFFRTLAAIKHLFWGPVGDTRWVLSR